MSTNINGSIQTKLELENHHTRKRQKVTKLINDLKERKYDTGRRGQYFEEIHIIIIIKRYGTKANC